MNDTRVQSSQNSRTSSLPNSPPSSLSSSSGSSASSSRLTTESSSSGEDPVTSRLRERQDRRERRQTARHQSFMNRTLIHGTHQAPENFDRKTTPQGQVYFVNRITGHTTWHDPNMPRDTSFLTEQELGALPDGWEVRHTATRRLYYVDHNTRTTQFTGTPFTLLLSSSYAVLHCRLFAMKIFDSSTFTKMEISFILHFFRRFILQQSWLSVKWNFFYSRT